ncbi:MAG TPA: thioredoxin family protein [Rhizomicrobium sp.]|nr:thioredoxin family protein [Rhizomicrobium sp.]
MKKILLSFLLLTCPALAAPAPKLSIAKLKQLPIVTMRPYDGTANADAQVAAAFARAQKSHKRVLIDLGGNWCPDCIVLTNLMKLPEMRRFMEAHYETVLVDVGRFNRNLQIPARFGISKKLKGVPALLIATPEGKLVNADNVFATADARNMTPQAIAAYLAKYAD